NEAAAVALAGVNLVDPAKPADSRDGVGVQSRSEARSPAPPLTLADAKRTAALAEKRAHDLHATEKAGRKASRAPAVPEVAKVAAPTSAEGEGTTRLARALVKEIGKLPRMREG